MCSLFVFLAYVDGNVSIVTCNKRKKKKKESKRTYWTRSCVLQTAIWFVFARTCDHRAQRPFVWFFGVSRLASGVNRANLYCLLTHVERPNKLPVSFQRILSYERLFWTRSLLSKIVNSESGEFFAGYQTRLFYTWLLEFDRYVRLSLFHAMTATKVRALTVKRFTGKFFLFPCATNTPIIIINRRLVIVN